MSVWIAYIIGQLVHWYLKADAVVKSTSPVSTYREWVTRNRRALVARLFIATLGFVAWDYYPDFVTHIGQILATYLTPGALRSVIEKLQFPLNVVTACAYGYLADSLLDKLVNRFPMLAGEIPKVNGDSKPTDQQKPPDPPNASGAAAGGSTVGAMLLALGISAMLLLCAPRAHGQTTIAPDTVKPKNVIMQPGGATGVDNTLANASKPAKGGTGAPAAGDCDAPDEVGREYNRTDALGFGGTHYVCANTGVATYAWEAVAGPSAVGVINVVTNPLCGLKKDNATDILAPWIACHGFYKSAAYFFPDCGFNPQGGGTANVACYFSSGQIVASYNGTTLIGPTPSVWNGLVSIRFPTNTPGVRFDTNCFGCKIANLGLIGADLWSSTNLDTWPDWTPASLVGSGNDGLQLLSGSPIVENVAIYGFARNGIFADGASGISPSSQPDAFFLSNVMLDGNRGNGFFSIGCDSNVGVAVKIKTRGNMLTGIYDYSCLGNTWVAADSALDGRSAISAGATSTIATIGDNGGSVLTITTTTPVAGWTSSTWITVAGTVSYNGTYKVTGGTSSNFTANYLGTPHAGEVVGTAGKASSTNVFATLTARSAGAGQAPTKECAYASRDGSSNQVHVNPYQESNSAPPCWGTGSLVIGGQLASTTKTATGQGWTWITNSGGGLYVKGGQAVTFENPSDSLLTVNLRAGATALQDVRLRFQDFTGANKQEISFQAIGSSLVFTDDATGVSWLTKNGNGDVSIRGDSGTHDVSFNLGQGRDVNMYCGTASTKCFKVLASDTNTYVNALFLKGANSANAAKFDGTFTGARIHTFPDITGNVAVYLSGTDATVDLASVASGACTAERTVGVTGAAFGDVVLVMAGTALEAGTNLVGKVTSAGNVKWQFCNWSAGAVDRASDTYTIKVVR